MSRLYTYTQYFPAKKEAHQAVLLVHGAGEHLDRYKWVINQWNEAGYSVFGGDLPGYGRSEGKKGHIHIFDDYVDAVDSWYEELKNHSGIEFPFVFGHSLGGLVVSRFMETRRRAVSGVVLSSPCFALSMKVPPWKEKIADILNIVYPSLVLSAGIHPEHVCRAKDLSEYYTVDPLNTKGASVRWYKELNKNMSINENVIHEFPDVPLVIHQSGSDFIVDAKKVYQWYHQLLIKDKTYREWPELYHEILNDPERERVFNEIVTWMNERS